MKKPLLVILSGAGISAESGLQTFRDTGGLWEGYNIHDVATPEAWKRNPAMVQDFYNQRRKTVLAAAPNKAHLELAALEEYFDVQIITQNIDDLHERAGSTRVHHLHGVITKSQSDIDSNLTYEISGWELKLGELCEKGSQLRPHVVWFGEAVPMIEFAAELCSRAEYFAVIGTSLQVYPAAGLVDFVPSTARKFIIDKNDPGIASQFEKILKPASEGVPEMAEKLKKDLNGYA